MGVVHTTLSFLLNAITQWKLIFFRKINLLGHSGHLDEKNNALSVFQVCYPSDINDLTMTCRDYKNALKM